MSYVGRVLGGRFQIQGIVLASSTRATLEAWDIKEQQPVILKVATGLSRDVQLRLVHEAELLSKLESPYIVTLLAARRDDELFFAAMPLVGRRTLRERLQEGRLSVPETLTVGISLLRALEAAHWQGLRHRDIKPENIVLDECRERAVLIDFGMAAEPEPAGSLIYMAPERLGLLERPADERADLYEAGLVLYECLSGSVPFLTSDLGDSLRARAWKSPPSLHGQDAEVSPVLEQVIFRLLETDPQSRYQLASAAADDMEQLQAGRTPVVGATDCRHQLTEPILVSREAEMERLEGGLRSAATGPCLLRVTGTSGSGKSRLLQEFARRAEAQGARVLLGTASHRTAQVPFSQLDSVFRPVAAELASLDEVREAVRPWGEVLSIALESMRAVFPLSGSLGDFQPQIVRSAQRVLEALPGVTVLILDDCQWSDDALFDLAELCLQQRQNTLVVLSFRSDTPEAHRLWSLSGHLVRLSALSRVATRALLESMSGTLPHEAFDWIWAASLGDPLMAVSSLHGLVECGALSIGQAGWELTEDVELKARVSRRGGFMLSQRLSLLSDSVQEVIVAGALLGRRFDVVLVATMLGLSNEQVRVALEEARRRHLLWRSHDGWSYTFTHDRVREVALEGLPVERRLSLHLAVAESLTASDSQRVYEIAYHFYHGGSIAQALPHALEAARRAQQAHSLDVAEEYYRMAHASIEQATPSMRFRILVGLGQVLSSRASYSEAESCFSRAREQAADRLDQVRIEAELVLMYSATDPKLCRAATERGFRLLGNAVPKRPALAALREAARIFVEKPVHNQDPDALREAEALGRLCLGFTTGF